MFLLLNRTRLCAATDAIGQEIDKADNRDGRGALAEMKNSRGIVISFPLVSTKERTERGKGRARNKVTRDSATMNPHCG